MLSEIPAPEGFKRRGRLALSMADLIASDWTFKLPRAELIRPELPRGLFTNDFHGKEVEDCCIAQVDFLGFSAILGQAAGRAAEIIQTFYQTVELHARLGARAFHKTDQPDVAIFQYADTVNIVGRESGPGGIRPVVLATAHLLASCHGQGLPARAGVSMGEVWAVSPKPDGGSHGDFVSGPGLACAHAVEGAQRWAGGALDPTNQLLMNSGPVQDLLRESWLVEWDVPWKHPDRAGPISYAVNWPKVLHVPDRQTFETLLSLTPDALKNPVFAEKPDYRRRAVEFYQRLGPGGLKASPHAWMQTPFGFAIPLMPNLIQYLLENDPAPPPDDWPAVAPVGLSDPAAKFHGA